MSLLRRIEGKQNVPPTPTPASPSTAPPAGVLNGRAEDLRLRRQALTPARDTLTELKLQIQNRLIAELDPKMDLSRTDEVRHTIREMFENFLSQEGLVLTRAQRTGLFEQIVAEILGLGPIQSLIEDESVSEIMVNGPRAVYAERQGKLTKTDLLFDSDDHVLRIIDRIVSPIGRRVDESQPYVDARLPDGSRVNIVIAPLALNGPTITIRKFGRERLRAEDLLRFGSISPEGLEFLKACVESRLNIVISGGTGSGKTTLLNVLSSFIPDGERIITIENAAELKLNQEHVVTLESRAPNIEGRGEVTIRQLVINCLRMRPDRIVVGECRGGETLDMLQAMNTGHDGSLTTLHSNSPRDTLARMETMSLMAGMELPIRAIREQIASAVDLIVHQERFRDGTRKITSVTEVQGMEGDVIVMQEVFAFQQTGFENGKVIGRLRPTGVRPKCTERLEAHDIYLPPAIFGATRAY